jgi:hypothetical protein
VLLIEKAAVRTSTDATFVLTRIVPSNHEPGTIVNVENQMRTIRGGASGAATGGVGHARGGVTATVRFGGTTTGLVEQPAKHEANAGSIKSKLRKWFLVESDDSRDMELMDSLSAQSESGPSTSRLDLAGERSGAPSGLDWLITLAAVWIMTGLFIDAHQHLFVAVESFLNPWHMTMYSGGVFAAAVLGIAIARNYGRAGSFWKAIPAGYAQSVFGVAGLLVGGGLDFLWHGIFGFEHQLDLLLSPPHLFLLSGLFFLITGPVRSGLLRPNASSLIGQLPMLVSLGLAFEVIQFVTQYGFYPEALMRDHPLSQVAFQHEQFVLSVFLFYRQALEISIVIWQSLLLAAAALYLVLRKQLHFGALVVICVVEKLWIGGELSSDLMELSLVVLASIAAGLAGDLVVAKLRPSALNPNAFRLLGFFLPAGYFAAYFALAVPMFGGTWWDASFVFGSIAEAGLVGLCISQLLLAGSQAGAA